MAAVAAIVAADGDVAVAVMGDVVAVDTIVAVVVGAAADIMAPPDMEPLPAVKLGMGPEGGTPMVAAPEGALKPGEVAAEPGVGITGC